MTSPYDSSTFDGISADTFYHIEPLPGSIGETDAALDSLAQRGWELVNIHGRNAIYKSSTLSQAGSHDAFGRLRASEPYTIGDYKSVSGMSLGYLMATGGTGVVSYNSFKSTYTLSTTGTSGSFAILQSKKYHNYLPGKSQIILQSFMLNSDTAGVIKRVGYFDDYNGIFLEQTESGSLDWVIRSSVNGTGSLSEERVSQANWNINPLQSGSFILDPSKVQLIMIDFQWLAVGRVRVGFVYEGRTFLSHVFDHTNKTTVPYMANPNLPIRYEIRNASNAIGSMDAICASVASEGGYAEAGLIWGVTTNNTLISVASGSTVPLLAIRLKNTVSGQPNRAYVQLNNSEVFATDKSLLMRVYKLPDSSYLTTSSIWTSVNADSVVEYNRNVSAFTDGREIINGFVPAGGSGTGNIVSGRDSQPAHNTKNTFIAQNYNSTDSEIYLVTATNLTTTSTTAAAALQWSEIY